MGNAFMRRAFMLWICSCRESASMRKRKEGDWVNRGDHVSLLTDLNRMRM